MCKFRVCHGVFVHVGTFSDSNQIYGRWSLFYCCQNWRHMCLQWVSVTMVYYGLLFASTSLNGDPYINFALVVSAELPTYPLYFFLPRIFGRKYILIANQLIAAICCVLGGLLITEPRYFLKLCFKSRMTYEIFLFRFIAWPDCKSH